MSISKCLLFVQLTFIESMCTVFCWEQGQRRVIKSPGPQGLPTTGYLQAYLTGKGVRLVQSLDHSIAEVRINGLILSVHLVIHYSLLLVISGTW